MPAGEVVNSCKMDNLNSKSRINMYRLPYIYILMLMFISCRHFPVGETPVSPDAREEYRKNLLQWNSMAFTDTDLNPVSPLPVEHYEVPIEALHTLNALFLIGFSVVSDAEAAKTGVEANHRQPGTAPHLKGVRRVFIIFDVPEKPEQEDPGIAGVLLDGNGWVLTVAHPFSNPSLANLPLYARIGEDPSWYSADQRMTARSSNLALVHFSLPGTNFMAPAFAQAKQGSPAFIGYKGTEEKILIEKTEETLQLGDSLVFRANLISRSIEHRDSLISGIPLVNKEGKILGLYYYQSLDGRFSGYAGWKELPGLIDSMIHLLHRELLSDLRRMNS